MKICTVREVSADDPSRQPHPPEQPKALLGESVQDRHRRRAREDADITDSLSNESGPVAMGDRGDKVAADVAVDDVQSVDGERKGDEQGEQATGSPTHLGRHEVPDCTGESPDCYQIKSDWLFAHTRCRLSYVTATRR